MSYKIKEVRELKNLTQEELAEKVELVEAQYQLSKMGSCGVQQQKR